MEFEWDYFKEQSNLKKHGLSIKESIETFYDPKGFELNDSSHSKLETRMYWIGKTKDGRVLTTWFTRREAKIRIIGCANWRKFRRYYNETTKVK